MNARLSFAADALGGLTWVLTRVALTQRRAASATARTATATVAEEAGSVLLQHAAGTTWPGAGARDWLKRIWLWVAANVTIMGAIAVAQETAAGLESSRRAKAAAKRAHLKNAAMEEKEEKEETTW